MVLTKNGEMRIYILPTKTSSDPETDDNDENGGCHSGKTTICQKHRFRHPDKKGGPTQNNNRQESEGVGSFGWECALERRSVRSYG